MWIEAVAALLVGASLVWLVFEPILAPARGPAVDAVSLADLEDAELTRSGAALSALKEVEFDRETGKLGDEDYALLRQQYAAEALEALRAESSAAAAPAEAGRAAGGAVPTPESRFCGDCGAPIGTGSRFCGGCGSRVAA